LKHRLRIGHIIKQGSYSYRQYIIAFIAGAVLPNSLAADDKSGYNIFNPTPKHLMREFVTDRPDKTESPISVDAGHFQHETDIINASFSHQDGESESSYLIGAPNLKVGLTNRIDLQFVMESFTYTTSGDKKVSSGNCVITTRLKVNIWGNDEGSTALALMPYVKIPINYKNVGNDVVEGGLIIPFSFSLTDTIGVGLMTQYDLLDDETGSGYDVQFVNSATIGTDLCGDLGGYLEVWNASMRGSLPQTTIDVGITYAFDENTQFDMGLNTGVSEAADDLNPFIGLSQRF